VSDNLFCNLFRWACRQGENFTTESFAWLLRLLLRREPAAGLRLLWWLCFGDDEGEWDASPNVIAQDAVEEGTPDIRIETQKYLVLVEVKVDTRLGDDQIGRYLQSVKRRSRGRTGRVVLLTCWPVEFAEREPRPHRHVRWYEVAEELRREMKVIKDEPVRLACGDFLGYLKEQSMTIERVGPQYAEGVVAMCRLIEMLRKALELASVPNARRDAGWNWNGYNLHGTPLWAGIRYNKPCAMILDYQKPEADRNKFASLEHTSNDEIIIQRSWNKGKPSFCMPLDDERLPFFALSKGSQLATLRAFVKQAYRLALSCMRDSSWKDA